MMSKSSRGEMSVKYTVAVLIGVIAVALVISFYQGWLSTIGEQFVGSVSYPSVQ